jgi:hypothetical protein
MHGPKEFDSRERRPRALSSQTDGQKTATLLLSGMLRSPAPKQKLKIPTPHLTKSCSWLFTLHDTTVAPEIGQNPKSKRASAVKT